MTDRDPDEALRDAFDATDLHPGAQARIEREVLAAYAISQRSLAAEWLELVRETPVRGTLLLAAAAVALVVATPLGALVALATGAI